MPAKHRDPRYFTNHQVGTDAQPGKLAQAAIAWSGLYSATAWRLDAVKATRAFNAWKSGGWDVGRMQNKDALNGREESCLSTPSTDKELNAWASKLNVSARLLHPNDHLGASTLIKRFWHLTWLAIEHPFEPRDFAMPNTRGMAAHEPFSSSDDEDDVEQLEPSEKYFAILALDGDDVLAMLPADTALACARALRAAFRGEKTLADIAKGIVRRKPQRQVSAPRL